MQAQPKVWADIANTGSDADDDSTCCEAAGDIEELDLDGSEVPSSSVTAPSTGIVSSSSGSPQPSLTREEVALLAHKIKTSMMKPGLPSMRSEKQGSPVSKEGFASGLQRTNEASTAAHIARVAQQIRARQEPGSRAEPRGEQEHEQPPEPGLRALQQWRCSKPAQNVPDFAGSSINPKCSGRAP